MRVKALGENIYRLRKYKGVTQEALGNAVGVSTQAVSKWECGGVPDIELLPLIADYYNVSIDELFGRATNNYIDIETSISKYISSFEKEIQMNKVFELCWTLERTLSGLNVLEEQHSLKSIQSKNKELIYSQMLFDYGISLMCLKKESPYFFVMPETDERTKLLLEKSIEYIPFFKLLSDKDAFAVLIFLYSRENKPFTNKLLEKKLNIAKNVVENILSDLNKFHLLTISEIEIDDIIQKIYTFEPNPSFIALLTFVKEMTFKPNDFHCFCDNRNKPYLNRDF